MPTKKGGSAKEVALLETLKPWLLGIFASHRPSEYIAVEFAEEKLYLHLRVQFNGPDLSDMDIAVSKLDKPPRQIERECWLGVHRNNPQERLKPWGEYAQSEIAGKGINVVADFNFAMSCVAYQGKRYTNFLFLVFFYVLKLHAQQKGRADYVIAADDASVSNGVSLQEVAVKKVLDSKMSLNAIMKTPLMYYERFGFVYPEKKEFFEKLLRTGTMEDLTRYYLDLKTLSLSEILKVAEELQFK